jgi:D-sedoheptulose 7-phosphate isomerase
MMQQVLDTGFKENQMSTQQSFSKKFLDDSMRVIESISSTDIEAVVQVIRKTRDQGGRLFLAGSGGGAGHASHATCDFRKLCGVESYCITDNVSELTARINDEGWDTSYSNWLSASRISSKDCLLVFSVGGGSFEPPVSMNLVKAVELAKSIKASVVGIVGRTGGALRQLADASVLVPTIDPSFVTPQAEGFQALIWHLIVSHPDLAASVAKWESIDKK